MDIFNGLTMIGGLSLFLFGMSIMGQALEKRAGNKLKGILEKMTGNPFVGFLTGCGVTAIIQSSSATTVMVVGFVNSGLMNLKQAINVIMGANVGTTITSWILSLSGISSKNIWVRMLKPSSFTPILALIGIIFYLFMKKAEKKDTGMILLGFATLMFGMETMSSAVKGLADVPAFRDMFIMFQNPFLGLLIGALLTAVIQSSSASVGILQALSVTGQVSIGAAVPIIMGQNIGTCVTAMISSVGANKNAKRASIVHLLFNIIGSVILLSVFSLWKFVFVPPILNNSATSFNIAIIHTIFNIICVVIMMPNASLLERLAMKIIPDEKLAEKEEELDARLLATPSLALVQCKTVALRMAQAANRSVKNAIVLLTKYSIDLADLIREDQKLCDYYEDIIGTYLVDLSSRPLSINESEETVALLKIIGDLKRISDYAANMTESTEELRNSNLSLSEKAIRELEVFSNAVKEALDLTYNAFSSQKVNVAVQIEPLKQVIDELKEKLRTRHILRMQKGECSIETGFIWSDYITDLKHVSDHCANIAIGIIEAKEHQLNTDKAHSRALDVNYKMMSDEFWERYSLK